MSMVCEVPLFHEDTEEIGRILRGYRHVAIVGMSNNEEKASYRVASYLKENGFLIYPVNPHYEEVLGVKAYPDLMSIGGPIEIVDIFRRPDAIPDIVEDAIRCKAQVIWMQSGIVNNQAAQRSRDAGLKVVMDKCMMMEHKSLIAGKC